MLVDAYTQHLRLSMHTVFNFAFIIASTASSYIVKAKLAVFQSTDCFISSYRNLSASVPQRPSGERAVQSVREYMFGVQPGVVVMAHVETSCA